MLYAFIETASLIFYIVAYKNCESIIRLLQVKDISGIHILKTMGILSHFVKNIVNNSNFSLLRTIR
jgi:hypothetical protein